MKPFVNFAILVAIILGSLVWLALGGVKDTQTYYKTIPELQKMGDAAHGKRLRVGGDVEAGSIMKAGSQVTFLLHQDSHQLKVVYRGTDPLPDTFKAGAQALADGRLGTDGVFEANKIQAKCASKYEVKPPQQLSHPASVPTKVTQNKTSPEPAS
jgi:cytochrome c-type biogenesis protein CcmE